jgi:murein DD-endopeptidase MepM/ murein hydrolase activator NlpD
VRRMRKSFFLPILLAAAAYLTLPMPGLSSSLPQKIGHAQNRIAGKKRQEGVLTTQITAFNLRIRSLQGDISGLQQRQDKVQVQLNAKQAELNSIRDRLQRAQDRLAKLRARLAQSKQVLAGRLVALYKDDAPDMVTVVLEANGFADLLDRADFLSRISEQDNRIVTQVRDLTAQVTKQAKDLGALEAEAQDATNQILSKRNEIASAKNAIVARQNDLVGARNQRSGALQTIRASRRDLEGHLHVLESKQAEIRAKLQAAQTGVTPGPAGPIRRGSGNFIWPVNGPVVSPFGMRWGRLHAGIDIAVPSGTPIRAAGSGVVAFTQPEASSGGYGNYTCINHGGGISTCYAHQASFSVSAGQSVSQGQVIGISDCTGHCLGPHLHFEVRINGAPVDPLGYL